MDDLTIFYAYTYTHARFCAFYFLFLLELGFFLDSLGELSISNVLAFLKRAEKTGAEVRF